MRSSTEPRSRRRNHQQGMNADATSQISDVTCLPHAPSWRWRPLLALALALPGAAPRSQVAVVDVRGPPVPRPLRARTCASTTLNEIQALGADTLRDRGEVERGRARTRARTRSRRSTPPTPPPIPASSPTTTSCRGRPRKGFRILITLAPDAPDWATAGGRGGNYKVDSRDFADFARAVGKRYSGVYSAACPTVTYWSIWNEPNHIFFIKPRSQAPRVYRRLVERGLPALKRAVPGARVFVGRAGAGRHRHQGDRAAALPAAVAVPGQATSSACAAAARARPAATASSA